MAVYRYQFCDLVTDRTIVELDLSGVKFDRRICQPGSFSGTAAVTNPAVAEQVAKIVPRHDGDLTTGPGRTVVHVWRDSEIWGSYVIWSAELAGDDRGRVSVDLSGASLESYLYHREIRENLTFEQEDQLDIARGLIAEMEVERPIGLRGGGQPSSGVRRDRVYRASEAAFYGERLEELSGVTDGPEWMIRTYLAHGERVREFVAAQRLGQDVTDHVWTQPGNVLSWSYPIDASDVATSWQARGDTPNDDLSADSEPLLSSAPWEDPRFRELGWPLLEKTVDYQGVTDQADLDAYASWWARRSATMMRIPQITVRLSDDISFTPNRLGDHARLTLVNEWFPLVGRRPSFSKSWRVIGVEVTPVSRSDGQEEATLIFEEPSAGEAEQPGPMRTEVA